MDMIRIRRELQRKKQEEHENKLKMLRMKKEFEIEKLFLKKIELEKLVEEKERNLDNKRKT